MICKRVGAAVGICLLTLTLLAVPASATAPDLTVEGITVSDPVLGRPATITATVRNLGASNAGSFKVRFFVDGRVIGERTVAGLRSGWLGSSTSVSVSWTPERVGVATIRVVVDPDNAVRESNELNNERTLTVRVRAPDLLVERVSVNPPSHVLGEVGVVVTVRNAGDADAEGFFVAITIREVASIYGREVRESRFVRRLGAGMAVSLSIRGPSLPAMSYTIPSMRCFHIEIVIDPTNVVREANEANNRATSHQCVQLQPRR